MQAAAAYVLRLSPHGESGLKSIDNEVSLVLERSLPAWGEWIEMAPVRWCVDILSVSPRMGRVD